MFRLHCICFSYKKKRYIFIAVLSCLLLYLCYHHTTWSVSEDCDTFPYRRMSDTEKRHFDAYPLENVSNIISDVLSNRIPHQQPINVISEIYDCPYTIRCHSSTELVIVVKSYVGNFQQRSAIRSTWKRGTGNNVTVVFVIGFAKEFVEKVQNEFNHFKDVVQFSFRDRYRNTIYKTIMTYNWIISNCTSANFVFFVDDDFFVNVPNVLKFARRNLENHTEIMYGRKVCFASPFRSISSKWFMSKKAYPFDSYPPFLSGGSILTDMSVVRKLQIAFQYVKILDLDDVYIGLVAYKLGITLKHSTLFVINRAQEMKRYTKYILSSHGYSDRTDLFKIWRELKNNG